MIIAKLLDDTTIELESGITGNKLNLEMRNKHASYVLLDILNRSCVTVALTSETKEKVEC